MTLNSRYAFCCRKDASFGAQQKNWMKIDPYYRWQKCRPLTSFWRHKVCAGVLWRGGIKRQWGNRKRRFFGDFGLLHLRHLRKWGQHYYVVLFSPLSPFQSPQNIWPWMALTGYLALNSVFTPVWLAENAQLRKIIAWKLLKIDTYCRCRQCKSSAENLVSGDIRFVRIVLTSMVCIIVYFTGL